MIPTILIPLDHPEAGHCNALTLLAPSRQLTLLHLAINEALSMGGKQLVLITADAALGEAALDLAEDLLLQAEVDDPQSAAEIDLILRLQPGVSRDAAILAASRLCSDRQSLLIDPMFQYLDDTGMHVAAPLTPLMPTAPSRRSVLMGVDLAWEDALHHAPLAEHRSGYASLATSFGADPGSDAVLIYGGRAILRQHAADHPPEQPIWSEDYRLGGEHLVEQVAFAEHSARLYRSTFALLDCRKTASWGPLLAALTRSPDTVEFRARQQATSQPIGQLAS